jgi:hypothetical protein
VHTCGRSGHGTIADRWGQLFFTYHWMSNKFYAIWNAIVLEFLAIKQLVRSKINDTSGF